MLRDIDAWEPKVKPGGFLSGHDFGNHPDVAKAVLQRAAEFNRTVHLSMDTSSEKNKSLLSLLMIETLCITLRDVTKDWFWYYYL